MASHRPPRFAQWLLGLLLPRSERAEVLGDLREQYVQRRARGRSATLWYFRQVAALPLWFWKASIERLDADVLEVRPVLRRLLSSPGFTAVAVGSLGLGIGANTAIFSVLQALVFESLPVHAPEELAFPYHLRPRGFQGGSNINSSQTADPETGATLHSNVSYPAFRAVQADLPAPSAVAAYTFARNLAVVDAGRPAVPASGLLASGTFLDVLGVDMALGRSLQPTDDDPTAPLVAALSHAFWQQAFGGDPGVLGRTIRVNGAPAEIVGVTGRGFVGLSPGGFFPSTEITLPLVAQPSVAPRWTPEDESLFSSSDIFWLRLIARIPGDEAHDLVQRSMTSVLRDHYLAEGRVPVDEGSGVVARLLPGRRGLDTVRGSTERPLKILAVVVLLVLLIACANVATLLLARGLSRSREMAVRKALGASRALLVWPILLESIVVATAGAVLGVLLAMWGAPLVAAALTAGMGVTGLHFQLDGRMLAMTGAVAVVVALVSGLIPALRATRLHAGHGLGTRGVGAARSKLASGLIIAQIAAATPLVIGGGLLLRTVGNLNQLDPGFDPSGLTVFALDASAVTDDPSEVPGLFDRVLANVRETPGVRSATLIENVFLSGWTSNTRVVVDGGDPVSIYMNAVGPDFFETFRIPIVAGRALDEGDEAGGPVVAVVNEAAARTLFGGAAIGRSFRRGETDILVVGVARDTPYADLRDGAVPTFFDAAAQRGSTRTHVAVRAASSGPELERNLRDAVARADAGLPITDVRTQEAQMAAAMSSERVFSRLLTLFGVFALLLASIGLHGITAFAVARRRSEMGIRLALGARPDGVLALVMRRVAAIALVGLALGLGLAYLATPVVDSLLYGMEPSDPTTFAGAALTLLVVALVAGWLPARRAARTDPMEVLGAE